MKANEINQSIFTSTLEHFINNVGLRLPYDSDPGFYKDHYDREVKARMNLGENDNYYVSERVSGVSKKDEASERNVSSMEVINQEVNQPKKRLLNELSGFTSQLTTQLDE